MYAPVCKVRRKKGVSFDVDLSPHIAGVDRSHAGAERERLGHAGAPGEVGGAAPGGDSAGGEDSINLWGHHPK